MQTVVETHQFLRRAKRLLSEAERVRLIDELAARPLAGDVIEGTGGVRKLRFATQGRGKSGSARIITFVYDEDTPIYLITCYGKNEKDDLSPAERNAFSELTAAIKAQYRRQRR